MLKIMLSLALILVLLSSSIMTSKVSGTSDISTSSDISVNLAAAPITLNLTTAPTAPITIDSTRHYFSYGGQTVALIGISGEYLPHIEQPHAHRYDQYCTYKAPSTTYANTYIKCLDFLKARGLNKIQMWLSLNQSPKLEDPLLQNEADPFPHEQPFDYAGNRKWKIGADTDASKWDEEFFNRVQTVVQQAQNRGIIVEVVLFDPWTGRGWGNPANIRSPWYRGNNVENIGFTDEKYFVSFEGGTKAAEDAANTQNARMRRIQVSFMKKVADKLNIANLHNFYWQLANEPDVEGVASESAIFNWHNYMAQELRTHEDNNYGRHHLISVNYSKRNPLSNLPPEAELVNGHYVQIQTNGQPDIAKFGAIKLVRSPLGTSLNRIIGFNETKITGIGGPASGTAASTRAEAWEFMLNSGGVYDHLSYNWFSNNESKDIRRQLGLLSQLFDKFPIANMTRMASNTSGWVQGLPPWSNPTTTAGVTSNYYWAAMSRPDFYYVLHIHHSVLSPEPQFTRYEPKPTNNAYNDSNLRVNLGNTSGCFEVTWHDPSAPLPPGVTNRDTLPTVNPISNGTTNVFFINWTASSTNYVALPFYPNYSYDIFLRVRRISTTPCS
jgi:hypothetical protein